MSETWDAEWVAIKERQLLRRERERQEYLAYHRAQGRYNMEIQFDELDESPFWTRDIGMVVRRRSKAISPEEMEQKPKPKEPIPVPAPTEDTAYGAYKAAKQELATVKKQLEKQSEFLKELVPNFTYIEQIFNDALTAMEADAVDDVYHIGELKRKFVDIRKTMAKHLPKEEFKLDPNGIKIASYATTGW